MEPIRVFLADDHALVRAGFANLLSAMPGIQIVGEASDGQEALDLIQQLRPDVVLMDIAMPYLSGLEVTSRLAPLLGDVRVLILSMHTAQEYVLQALRVGAAGYLVKTAGPEELKSAVQSVARGQTYLSPRVAGHVSAFVRETAPAEEEDPLLARLTTRQRETLRLIADGHSTQEIAAIMGISPKTVESHRSDLMARLEIFDVPGLVRLAIRSGLISSND